MQKEENSDLLLGLRVSQPLLLTDLKSYSEDFPWGMLRFASPSVELEIFLGWGTTTAPI
jgi:hypothetical protein